MVSSRLIAERSRQARRGPGATSFVQMRLFRTPPQLHVRDARRKVHAEPVFEFIQVAD